MKQQLILKYIRPYNIMAAIYYLERGSGKALKLHISNYSFSELRSSLF